MKTNTEKDEKEIPVRFFGRIAYSFHWVGAYVARGHALPACDGGYTNIAHGAAGTPQPESP